MNSSGATTTLNPSFYQVRHILGVHPFSPESQFALRRNFEECKE